MPAGTLTHTQRQESAKGTAAPVEQAGKTHGLFPAIHPVANMVPSSLPVQAIPAADWFSPTEAKAL